MLVFEQRPSRTFVTSIPSLLLYDPLLYVASRITESALIATGIVSVLSVLTLREDLSSTAVGLDTTGQALVAVHDATFLLGPQAHRPTVIAP